MNPTERGEQLKEGDEEQRRHSAVDTYRLCSSAHRWRGWERGGGGVGLTSSLTDSWSVQFHHTSSASNGPTPPRLTLTPVSRQRSTSRCRRCEAPPSAASYSNRWEETETEVVRREYRGKTRWGRWRRGGLMKREHVVKNMGVLTLTPVVTQ